MSIRNDLEIIKTLQESERFIVQLAMYKGEKAVLKTAKTEQMKRNVQQELDAYRVYGLLTDDPECPFSIASLLDEGEDWLLMSFLEGEVMSTLKNADNSKKYYQKLAQIMAYSDNKVNSARAGAITYATQITPTQKQRGQRMLSHLDRLHDLGLDTFKTEMLKATRYFEAHRKSLQTGFVNADLTTAHVMVNDDTYAIFDFENAQTLGPRFSDAVNMTTQIWFVDGDQENALFFWDEFWKLSQETSANYSAQLRTLFMRRCIGFTEELLTEPDQYHNTSLTMNTQFAQNISDVFSWAQQVEG